MVVCPNVNTLPGIDTSGHQPNTQWSSVQKAGQMYGYVKATEGLTYANPVFSDDWPTIKTVGMVRGAYHYFHASDDPVDQANFFLNAIGAMADDDLPPALDWEVDDNAGVQTNIQGALVWLETVEKATGKTPLIYTRARFFNKLGNPIEFARYPLWIAETEVICPKVPPPWKNYAIWQWSMRHVNGVKTIVDLDLFNGSNDQLDHFTHNGTL
ncbi:MAG: GH25 family lysozyme [Oligoflexia bacterium]|nr:GH25 family lysozyme [Oligoflexia bacterium]